MKPLAKIFGAGSEHILKPIFTLPDVFEAEQLKESMEVENPFPSSLFVFALTSAPLISIRFMRMHMRTSGPHFFNERIQHKDFAGRRATFKYGYSFKHSYCICLQFSRIEKEEFLRRILVFYYRELVRTRRF